jgi:uncharacterized protein YndB with AHSA1/START domain
VSARAARELRAETTIEAPVDRVWATLTDLRRMPEWSPELVKMFPLKRGGLRVGQQYLALNRRKAAIWPSRNVVAIVEPRRVLAWDTKSSGARWIYELSPEESGGTKVVQRRPVPHKITLISRMYAPVFQGGSDSHSDELEHGMGVTLARLKVALEQ